MEVDLETEDRFQHANPEVMLLNSPSSLFECSGCRFAGKRLVLKAVMVFVLLFVLICSCKKDDNGAGPEDSFAATTGKKASTFTIRFRPQWHHQAQFAGIYMAAHRGFYANLGLNVDIQSGGPDFPPYEAIKNGSTDICTMFLLPALNSIDPDLELVNLAQVSQRSALMLIAKRSRGINSPKDLKGKKVGLWHSEFRDVSLAYLNDNSIKANIIPVGWQVSPFIYNAVDAINVMLYNEYHQVITSGVEDSDLFQLRFSDIGYNIPEDGIYTTRAFYDAHTQACKDFAEATMDGWVYAINHMDETLSVLMDILKRDYIPANRPHQKWMLEKMRELILASPEHLGKLNRSDYEAAITLLKRQNPALKPPQFERFHPGATN